MKGYRFVQIAAVVVRGFEDGDQVDRVLLYALDEVGGVWFKDESGSVPWKRTHNDGRDGHECAHPPAKGGLSDPRGAIGLSENDAWCSLCGSLFTEGAWRKAGAS